MLGEDKDKTRDKTLEALPPNHHKSCTLDSSKNHAEHDFSRKT